MPNFTREQAQLAVLGITIDADAAIRQVGQLKTELGGLGDKARESTGKTDGLSAAIGRMKRASVEHADQGLAKQIAALDIFQGATRKSAVELGFWDSIVDKATHHSGEHSLGLNRVERSMSGVIERSTGLNSALGILGSTFLKFGTGDIYTLAIVGGIAAAVAIYDKLTEGIRKAREEQEKLTKALADQFRPKTGPESATDEGYMAALAQQKSARAHLRILMGSSNDLQVAAGYGALGEPAPLMGRSDLITSETERLRQANQAIGRAQANGAGVLPTITTHQDLSGQRKAAEEALQASKEYWRKQYDLFEKARTFVADLQRDMKEYVYDSRNWGRDTVNKVVADTITANAGSFSMPNIGLSDGLTKEQIKTREKMGILIDDQNKNADKLSNVIWGASAQMANAIVGALNIGGGGKGSGLGGALGGTAGFAIGYGFGGPIGGAIGATVGNIAGSLLGGLFDHHKKAVDKNTDALNALTSALYNSPSGYKVAGARYRADDGRRIYEATSQEAYNRRLRGGVGSLAVA